MRLQEYILTLVEYTPYVTGSARIVKNFQSYRTALQSGDSRKIADYNNYGGITYEFSPIPRWNLHHQILINRRLVKYFLPCYSYNQGKDKKFMQIVCPTQGRQMSASLVSLGIRTQQTFSDSWYFGDHRADTNFFLIQVTNMPIYNRYPLQLYNRVGRTQVFVKV